MALSCDIFNIETLDSTSLNLLNKDSVMLNITLDGSMAR